MPHPLEDSTALVKGVRGVALQDRRLSPPGPREVAVRIAWAGICRTDLSAARGELPAAADVVLGHEGSGVVESVGQEIETIRPGQRVAFDPRVPCGDCRGCAGQRPCHRPRRLGLERDGVFARRVVVPQGCVVHLPPEVPLRTGVYLEPLAAALGVFTDALPLAEPGVVYGDNRIGRLTLALLRIKGATNVHLCGDPSVLPRCSLGFAIEARPDPRGWAELVEGLIPGGTLVLKSRPPQAVALPVRTIVEKRLRVQGLDYGSFTEAARMLADPGLPLLQLLGKAYALAEFEAAFVAAASNEHDKACFCIDDALDGTSSPGSVSEPSQVDG